MKFMFVNCDIKLMCVDISNAQTIEPILTKFAPVIYFVSSSIVTSESLKVNLNFSPKPSVNKILFDCKKKGSNGFDQMYAKNRQKAKITSPNPLQFWIQPIPQKYALYMF